MSPSPTPVPDDAQAVADLVGEFGLVFGAIAAIVIAFGIVVFGAMLLRASRYPWPVPIIAPLAMLSLVFGLAGLVSSELVPLAGAGIGALAGVLTSQLGRTRDTPEVEEPPTKPEEDPLP